MLSNQLPEIKTPLPGPKSKEMMEKRKEAIPAGMGSLFPLAIARGEGAILEDLDGNRFLDFIGGVGVMNIGYSHPEVIQAVEEQTKKYFHIMMSVCTHPGYIALADKLNQIVPVRGDKRKTMLVNCGAEAVETR